MSGRRGGSFRVADHPSIIAMSDAHCAKGQNLGYHNHVAPILCTTQGAARAIDLPLKHTYHDRQLPYPLNWQGVRFPITEYSASSVAAGWVWCMKPKTSSWVAASR